MDASPPVAPATAKRGRPRLSDEERKAKRRLATAQRKADKEDAAVRAEMGLPPPRKGRTTKAHVSQEIRLQVLQALDHVGGVKFLIKEAKKTNNAGFMSLLGKCLVQSDGTGDQSVTFVVQQVNISAAPVSGVISSPIAGHVAPPRLVAKAGEVIDMDEDVDQPPGARHG